MRQRRTLLTAHGVRLGKCLLLDRDAKFLLDESAQLSECAPIGRRKALGAVFRADPQQERHRRVGRPQALEKTAALERKKADDTWKCQGLVCTHIHVVGLFGCLQVAFATRALARGGPCQAAVPRG